MNSLVLSLSVNYDGFELSVELNLPMKGIIGIFGHSGSGKSTLLRAISGLEQNVTGQITLAQTPLLNSTNKLFIKPEQRHIGLVFQNSRLFPHLNVKQNLNFAYQRRQTQQLKLDDIIALTQLSPLLIKNVAQLSGGEQQRVALARALLCEPKLLLLDEPLSALDNNNKAIMLALIDKVQKKLNIPVLYVSHSLTELQQVADHLLVMAGGRVKHFGNIHQIIHLLNHDEDQLQQTSLSLPIKTHLPNYGLTCLALRDDLGNEQEIYLPLQNLLSIQESSDLASGHYLRCYIAANDISITLSAPKDSSIVNQLAGIITEVDISTKNQQSILVTIRCHQQDFFARITTWSFEQLKLAVDKAVYIQFKAGAVRTLSNY